MSRKIGKYDVLGKIGEGGMASVYKARDRTLGREVALKLIHQFLQEGERARRRFLNEARVAAALTHPNIVTIYELGEENGVPFIAMESLQGPDLQECMGPGRPLSPAQALEVARQVALGLEHAHGRGVIHRDIKPSNIKLLPSGLVKLLDFGIAKLASEHLTKTGQTLGTPSYMSPEQITGQTVTPATDIFSFGVVLHEALSGTLPFRGAHLQELIAAIVHGQAPAFPAALGIEAELEAFVRRCLAKEPSQRPESFTAILTEIGRLQAMSGTATATAGPSVSHAGPLAVVASAVARAAEAPAPAGGLGQFTRTDGLAVSPRRTPVRGEASDAARPAGAAAPGEGLDEPGPGTASVLFLVGLVLFLLVALVLLVT